MLVAGRLAEASSPGSGLALPLAQVWPSQGLLAAFWSGAQEAGRAGGGGACGGAAGMQGRLALATGRSLELLEGKRVTPFLEPL